MSRTKIFPPNVLPQSKGVYRTCAVDVETGEESEVWGYSFFDATDRIWGCTHATIKDAIEAPDFEFAHQNKRWAELAEKDLQQQEQTS